MSDFVAVRDSLVHVVEHGSARPRHGTAVLLHGFTCDHRLMTGAFEPVLSRRDGWRRVYLDLPGMGRSVAGAGIQGTDDVIDVVAEVIAKIVPEGPVVLVGQSFGGYVTQGLIATDPGRYAGVCLVVPVAVAEHARRTTPEQQVLVRDDDALADLTDAQRADLDTVTTVQDRRVLQRTRDEIDPGIEIADDAALQRISSSYTASFETAPSERFDGPGLLVAGRQDSMVGYADQWALLERFPRMTYAALDRAAHNLHLEQDVLFTALTHEWLDRVEESLT